jgi:hypothetical protein
VAQSSLPGLNVVCDVYRGFNPQDPYAPPNTPAAVIGLQGFLRHHLRNGRFGYVPAGAQPVYWTHVLAVPVGTDVRSAWNSEQNAFNEAQGDTVLVHDYPAAGTCCAFVCVMVQERSRGQAGPYLRCYLDRARPSYGAACPDPTLGPITNTCCPGVNFPQTIHATLHNVVGCPLLDGVSLALPWNPFARLWSGTTTVFGNQQINIGLACTNGQWAPAGNVCGAPMANVLPLSQSCTPFALTYSFQVFNSGCCGSPATMRLTYTT